MSNKNNISSTAIIAVLSVVVLAMGYFLIKTSPKSSNQNTQTTAITSGMHEEPSVTENNEFNSLIGKPMPDIQLSDKDGKAFTPADFKGKNTVLFFNEGLMCYPACWNQMAAFGSDKRFNNDQTQAISVVVDSAKDWQTAIARMPQLAKATTMFDMNANASRQLGLLTTNSSMHKGYLPGHTYVVLDKNAVVKYVFDDPNMAIANDMLFEKIGEFK